MMTRSFRDEWSAALRSGEFPQTVGCLNRLTPINSVDEGGVYVRPVGLCCLGVRCELDVRKGLMLKTLPEDRVAALYGEICQEEGSYVSSSPGPLTVARWGIANDHCCVGCDGDCSDPGICTFTEVLVGMNDADRLSFAQIADWLDAQEVREDDIP